MFDDFLVIESVFGVVYSFIAVLIDIIHAILTRVSFFGGVLAVVEMIGFILLVVRNYVYFHYVKLERSLPDETHIKSWRTSATKSPKKFTFTPFLTCGSDRTKKKKTAVAQKRPTYEDSLLNPSSYS